MGLIYADALLEIAPSLIGLCRWMLHFMVWMLDELITLRHSLKNPRIDRATLQAKRGLFPIILSIGSFE